MTTQWWPQPQAVANPGWQLTQRVRFVDEPTVIGSAEHEAAIYTVIATTPLMSLITRNTETGPRLVQAVDWSRGIRGPIAAAGNDLEQLLSTGPGRWALLNDLLTGNRQIADYGWSFIRLPTPGIRDPLVGEDLTPRLFDVHTTTLV